MAFDDDFDESENIEDRRDDRPMTFLDTVAGNLDDQINTVVQRARGRNPALDAEDDNPERQEHRRELGLDFEDGGAVEGEDEYSALGDFEDQTTQGVNSALKAVNAALMFGRQKYGMTGQQKPKQSFADGGLVEEDEEPQQFPGDEMAIPVPPQTTELSDERPTGIPEEGPMPPQRNRVERMFSENVAPLLGGNPVQALGRRLLGYIQSADADPQMSRRAEMEVDPEGVLDEDTRKLLAVQLAQQRGGTEASWRVLQDYRKKYDGYRAFAAAALQNQDLQGAARAASQAYPNILDGTSISFQPGQNGVIANIKPRSGEATQVQLTPEQFNRWLTGDEGQYDMVLARGGPAQLQQLLAQTRPATPGQPPAIGEGRRSLQWKGVREPVSQQTEIEPTDNELLRRQYPWASQSEQLAGAQLAHREAGRNREAQLERRIAPAQIGADSRERVAEIRAVPYAGRTQATFDAKMAEIEARNRRGERSEALRHESTQVRALVAKMMNNQAFTPEEQRTYEQIMQSSGGAPPARGAPPAQPGQTAPRAGTGAPAARPPGAHFKDAQGRFYDRYGRPL